ncbi:MAG TPA: PDZ domain-containing protein, partial [Thermoanaerobaculia bacterium]|nr:PDZ domain-containing protein [Thermoanaerobaculia bacterium]
QARELGVHGGVYLFEVTGGAASAAGLRRGDIVTSYGKLPVLNPHDLNAAIASHPRGLKIPVQGLRYREDTKRLEPLSVTVSPGKLGAGFMPI